MKPISKGDFVHNLAFVALRGAMALAAPAVAQDAPQAGAAAGAPATGAAATRMAKIVMYRGSGVIGATLGCPIRYMEKEVVELGRGKYAERVVPAGHYILTNKTRSVDIRLDPGEAAHVCCQIEPGMLTGQADLQIVGKESFEEHQGD